MHALIQPILALLVPEQTENISPYATVIEHFDYMTTGLHLNAKFVIINANNVYNLQTIVYSVLEQID
jgi:hypothetical protein